MNPDGGRGWKPPPAPAARSGRRSRLLADWATTQVVRYRYKDLTLVEQNFRTSKTPEMELRPIHVP